MIICEEQKWIFIRNTKTASRSLSKFLLKKFNCYEFEKYHSSSIPKEFINFKIFFVLRNPLSRAVSHYDHIVKDNIGKHCISFREYLNRKKFFPIDGDCNFFLQYDIIKKIEQFNIEIMFYENITTDVQKQFGEGILETIGKSNRSKHWMSYYDKKTLDLALNVFHLDFKNFKFKNPIPPKIFI
jgi:hypothetical protein